MAFLIHDLILTVWALVGALMGWLMVQGFKSSV